MQTQFIDQIAEELSLSAQQVTATAALIADGGTVPFIARYRKEQTGELDEVQIMNIRDRLQQLADRTGPAPQRRPTQLHALTAVYFRLAVVGRMFGELRRDDARQQ